jgi:CubicO group peptidase (beta-lactamase class C family)
VNDSSGKRISRRDVIRAGLGAAAISAIGSGPLAVTAGAASQEGLYPRPEGEGGWQVADSGDLGVNPGKLREAVEFHDHASATVTHGGAILVVRGGSVIAESYVTGVEGGPRNWTAETCNDMKSSTKSVFGTAVGVFLEEYRDEVTLDTPLVGTSRADSLIPQIWDQPITDSAKTRIKVKHVLSMTSGHETREPWLAPTARRHYPGYSGAFQMYEYCFGWWHFDDIRAHHFLKFEPGSEFNYSNYGLEQLALAMRNLSGELVGPYAYDRVLGPIGMSRGIRDNMFRDMPYADDRELNFAEEPGWGVGGSSGCDAYGADMSESPYGLNSVVGSTFRCTARDFARLAYLWLRRGRWEGRQLIPEAWLDLATRRYVRDDGTTPSPYGYTFWVMDEIEGVPSDLHMSRGHNLNHSFVIPSLDLVVVRQGNDNRRTEGDAPFMDTLIQKIVAAVD